MLKGDLGPPHWELHCEVHVGSPSVEITLQVPADESDFTL